MCLFLRALPGSAEIASHGSAAAAENSSDHDPLDLIERHLILAPVVEPGRPSALVVGHLLRDLELAAVPRVLGNPGPPERMAADLRLDGYGLRSPTDHLVDIRLPHRAL